MLFYDGLRKKGSIGGAHLKSKVNSSMIVFKKEVYVIKKKSYSLRKEKKSYITNIFILNMLYIYIWIYKKII
jgi:hypothetical protein